MGIPHTSERLLKFKEKVSAGGETLKAIAEELGIAQATSWHLNALLKHGQLDAAIAKAKEREARQAKLPPKTPKRNGGKPGKKGRSEQAAAKAERMAIEAQLSQKQLKTLNLAREGYLGMEIAAKTGSSPPTIYAHIKKLRGLGLLIKGEHANGTGSIRSERLDPKICIGIAYAEVERFIGHLSERLAVPTTLLRSRLSELLGRSPMR